MNFTQQLKKHNPTLYQINKFIISAKELGYGEIEFTINAHNYQAKIVSMKAVKPDKKTLAKSVTKRIMVKEKSFDIKDKK